VNGNGAFAVDVMAAVYFASLTGEGKKIPEAGVQSACAVTFFWPRLLDPSQRLISRSSQPSQTAGDSKVIAF